MAFENDKGVDPGISVISLPCIAATGSTICEHINKYYAKPAGDPIIFCIFPSEDLPENHRLEQEDSDTGDNCHHNIKGVDNDVADNWFKLRHPAGDVSNYQICLDNGTHRQLTFDDLPTS